jgi:parallel beta-helix repeat protein
VPALRPIVWNRLFTFLMAAAIAASMSMVPAKPAVAAADTALALNGSSQYATLGSASDLRTATFTIELWFKRTGTGVATSTGNGGFTNIVPLITTGRAEAENAAADVNYFLGINLDTNTLAADFEEGASGANPSANHPVSGSTTIAADGSWHHAAATYDGTDWFLYLDGVQDGTASPGQPANAATNVPTVVGSSLNTGLTAAGYFAGVIDEVRIWNVARSQGQIQADKDSEINSGTGLLGVWHLNEGTGSSLTDSSTNSISGAAVGGPAWVDGFTVGPPPPANYGLSLNGTSQYVTFGTALGLDTSEFTLELWFNWTGGGTTASTGSGGISAIPLLTKGLHESDGSNVDANWFLGIAGGKLAADFEDMASGANHPVTGTTTITTGVWHHAAATYGSGTWNLYLDGALDATLAVTGSPIPRSDSIQHAGIGTALNSTGVTEGRFQGSVDEARVWNVARTLPQILTTKDIEITTPQTNLLGVWNMDEGTGSSLSDSSGNGITGTIVGSPSWVDGFVPPTPGNAAPVAVADAYTTGQDTLLNVPAPGVLGNDTDADADPLTAILDSDVSHGSLTLNSDGSFSYMPTGGYNGPDSFTYHANDATDDSNVATVSIGVGNSALDLGSSGAYVTFGDPTKLDLAEFTVETWFKRTGTGVPNTTGTNGIPNLVPLLTHGAPQAENSNVDANWILGISTSGTGTTNVLAADFEEGAGGSSPGLNHPVYGTTVITDNVWHHAAATYDGTTWHLYLDGSLEATLAVGQPVRSDSIQRVALGAMITSTDSAVGRFDGVLDEARVWDHARTGTEIGADMDSELTTGTGLVARWGLNEGSGATVADSLPTPADGTIMGAGYSWVSGFVPPTPPNNPPDAPTLNAPSDGATGVSTSPTLDVGVSDPDGDPLTVTYYGRPYATGSFAQIAQHTGITAASDTAVWPSLTADQEYEWYVTADDGTDTTTGPTWTFHTAAAPAADYYVDNTNGSCSDAGPGSQATPFCTIGKAASLLIAGQTVRVVAGTYAETVNGPNSGTAGNPITYSAAPGVTVTGNGTASGNAFRMSSKSYIVIDGFTITDTVDYGIYAASSNHITISNNHVSSAGSPVSGSTRMGIYFTNTDDSVITGNTSDHNSQDGIRLTGGSSGNLVSDNISFGNAEEWQRNATGIQVTGIGSDNNSIINNITYANEDSGIQCYSSAQGNLIIGNLSYGNGDHGIDNNNAPNNVIVGNTVHGNVTAGINLEGSTGSFGATLANNISVDNGLRHQTSGTASGQPTNIRVDANSIAGTTLDYDLIYETDGTSQTIQWNGVSYTSLAAFQSAVPGQETHGLEGDPLFAAPAPIAIRPAAAPYNVAINVGDYHLTAGSPAIDSANSGASNERATDIEGNARVDDPATTNTGAGTRSYDDRGAYEFQPSGSTNTPPVATDDTYDVSQDTTLNEPAPGVLGNDNDADLDPLTAVLDADVAHGSLTLNSDGSFSYTPTAGYSGPDTFTYHAYDGMDSSNVATVTLTVAPATGSALDLGSSSAYVTFGDPSKLDLAQFTIETWFMRTGAGISSTTGTNGFTHAIPLVTHGAPDVDNHDNNDEDWILAIDADTNTIAADFEQGAGGTTPSSNNPVHGTTVITDNVWHHGAATYDGTTLNLYLDGNLEASVAIGEPTRSDTTEQAALGTMLTANGTAKGFFDGVIDEARVWNRALTGAEISESMNEELTTGSGLVARWGLNEGSGTSVGDSITSPAPANGTITGTGYSWVAGAPFNVTAAPDAPVLVAPSDGAIGVSTSPTLSVSATDQDSSSLDVDFYGRAANGSGPTTPFTLVVLPDTQNYVVSDSAAALFNAQTQWIADQQSALNIAFASQLGDVTESGTDATEWARASTAMGILDSAGVPYSITVGNHDGYATGYPTFLSTFGASRFAGKSWYGGYLGDASDGINDFGQNRGNLDSYQLFSADGMDFIVLNLELDAPTAYHVADWAGAVLSAYANRRAIVITHAYLTTGSARATSPYFLGSGGMSAADLWQSVLSQHCNVFMVLSGHEPGEARLTSTNTCGQPVHQMLQDYQNYSNGGDGWLRYYVFDPSNNQINAYTYSPVVDQFEIDSSSQFTLAYDMQGAAFNLLDTQTITSGQTASTTWPGLTPGTSYEWYAVVRDGLHATTGPTWTFTTGGSSNNPPVADDQTLSLPAGASTGGTLTASDADSDPLTFTIVGLPTQGTVTLNDPTTGAFTYFADNSASGSDTFTFSANDGSADSNQATVTISFSASQGYWLVAADGGIFTFGNAGFFGSTGGPPPLDAPVVGMVPTADRLGYWLVAADGGIFTFGDAGFFGSIGGQGLSDIVGMAATPDGLGYWLVASDGQVYTFGDATYYGSAGVGVSDIVGMGATPSGNGYWLVGADGDVYPFGGATDFGSMGGQPLDQPVVGMAPTPSGDGYWLVATDGGIFTFGDAGFYGSMGGQPLDEPVVGMAATPTGNGYWLVASDGGIFAFGDAGFYGSMGGQPLDQPMIGMGG